MMTDPIMRNIESELPLDGALRRIELYLGLRYQPHQWSDVLRMLKPAVKELGLANMAECVTWLAEGEITSDAIRILAKHLTIGESYFFREIVVFSLLKEHVLPELMKRKAEHDARSIRIWSAGCSTGEEVYSLAILLDSFLREKEGWTYSVLGTDINPIAIERAQSGIYREWSFRDISEDLIRDYFTLQNDGRRKVVDRVRENTDFHYLNLVEAPNHYPAGFDIVLCRNVLMYFTRPNVQKIVHGFRRSVVESGWLIPSLTETTLINNPGFDGVRFGDATLFRKQARIAHILSLRHRKEITEIERQEAPREKQKKGGSFTQILKSAEKQEITKQTATPSSKRPSEDKTLTPRINPAVPETSDERRLQSPVKQEEQLPLAAEAIPSQNPVLDAAMHLADEGKLEEALTKARSAVDDTKMDANARFIYATILRESGETSRAMKEFQRALYLDPDFIPAHFAMGSLYRHLGQHDRAHRHLRNALNLLKSYHDKNAVVLPGEISAGRMIDIIQTMIEQ
ncbi:MAG: hypothetical protein C0600_06580 [Ignavibacteria bacterium]|nr:MAG: hypothetical protein C0600_06580 [Ignavibacteria bacterium]